MTEKEKRDLGYLYDANYDKDLIAEIEQYERDVTSKRG